MDVVILVIFKILMYIIIFVFSVCEDYIENKTGYFVYDSVTSTKVNINMVRIVLLISNCSVQYKKRCNSIIITRNSVCQNNKSYLTNLLYDMISIVQYYLPIFWEY